MEINTQPPKRINGLSFFDFHFQLNGYDFHKNGYYIPRFILWYKGYNPFKLINNHYKNITKTVKLKNYGA